MYEEELRTLLQLLRSVTGDHTSNPTGALAVLISETIKLRDRLKQESGITLTVSDTRVALDALESSLKGQAVPDDMTTEQKLLVETWRYQLTRFGRGSTG